METAPDFKELFEDSFRAWYKSLHRYAYTMLKSNELASEAVQGVFIRWWDGKTNPGSLAEARKYLFTAVYRNALNVRRNEATKEAQVNRYGASLPEGKDFEDSVQYGELNGRLQEVIGNLPQQCRAIFEKSRFEEKRYTEIAQELNLSIKTVEAQMTKALRILREKMHHYVT